MEDDLELRRYIRSLFRGAWLILVLAVIGGAAAFAYGSLRSTAYNATTVLAISRPAEGLSR
jgi:uncharacterized protein involved in exopolysaccharide biosynthesis